MATVRTPIILLLALLLLGLADATQAATELDAETMKAALHTDTEEEDGFIQKVLDKVDNGELPKKMVYSTFLWAKRKRTRRFQYFKWGMIKRAEKIGVDLTKT
jgi:hypothetical protein